MVDKSHYNQPYPVNFVSTTRILKEGITPATSLYSLTPSDLSQTISYQDGLGRTFQIVGVGQSAGATPTDIISPVAHSKQGTIDTTFLPYAATLKDGRFKVNAIRNVAGVYTGSEQQAFYQNTAKVAQDGQPFARTISRTAPDGRVIEQGAAGAAWQPGGGTPHTVRNTIVVNTASYPVRLWKTDGTTTGNYPVKTVAVSITTDENGNQVRTFTNKLGQTVLKQVQLDETIETLVTPWLDTYYIYDNYGRLVCELPPRAMKVLGTAATLNAYHADAGELVYRYVYDAKGRLVEKKVPGAAWEYLIYDQFDRVVLTQDGNLRVTNDWRFVKYDYLNRPVFSGLYKNTVQTTRADVQNLIVTNYSGQFEIEQNNAAFHGYSNTTYPITNNTTPVTPLTVLSVNYYDHYNFDRAGAYDYKYDSLHFSGIPNTRNKNIRGLPTGSKKVIIDANGSVTTNWLISAVFYDQYERPVQVQSNNHLNFTVQDKTSILYDFVRTTKSKTTHTGPTTVNITRRYTFDHAGRVSGVYQTIDALPEQQLASYTYNALGQLIDKKLHNTGGSNFLQSIDYRYNIRGWLTSINNAQISNDGTLNDDTGDYFGMELSYNTAAGMSNTPYYNGNISAVKWKAIGTGTTGTTDQRSYKYEYDKSDKLETATFQANAGSAWTKEVGSLNEAMTYDHNGNILSLNRNHNLRGLSGITVTNTTQTIDNLTYTYRNSGKENQILKVEDAALTAGFKNGVVNGANEYTYATDGSMTKDENKGISTILYNLLGKPRQVTFTDGRTIAYTYGADGNKLKMGVTVSGVTTTTDYASGFVYTNNALSFFGSPEGRVVKNGSTYEQQYAISDHQGNTRVLFSMAKPANYYATATWEGNAYDSASHFTNVVAANKWNFPSANHTSGGTMAIRMNQTYKIGPAKSLAVYPGDKVDLEVWEYHEGESGFGTTGTPIATLITNVAGVFGGVSGAPDLSGAIYNGVNSAITGFGTGGNQGNNRPAAYFNYILFDKNYKVLSAGWQLAPATIFTKQKLSFATIDVKEAGFVFAWLSYDDDSNNWVYFDDFKVKHTKYNNVIQYNEYYPFGMQTAASWTRENVTGNNYLANGGTELNATSMVYDLDYRNYDPVLGRMNQVDPMAAKYPSLSPYNFSFNDPVTFADPNGADPMPGEPDHVAPWEKYTGRAVVNNQRVHDNVLYTTLQYSAAPLFDLATGGSLMNNPGSAGALLHDAAHLSETAYVQRYNTAGTWRLIDYFVDGDRSRYIDTELEVNIHGITRSYGFKDPSLVYDWNQVWRDYRAAVYVDPWDYVHGGLDAIGLVPVAGEVADGINALLYWGRGDNLNAGLSTAGMVPFAGWGATGLKVIRKAVKFADEVAAIKPDRIAHIMQGHHAWSKVFPNADWEKVKPLIQATMEYGSNVGYKGVSSKMMYYNGFKIQVVYTKIAGEIRISDAWVLTK
jgi:RHS repeat-associated protein